MFIPLMLTFAPSAIASKAAGVHMANLVKYFFVTAAVPSPPVTALEAVMCRGFSPLTLREDGFALIENPAVVAPTTPPARVC